MKTLILLALSAQMIECIKASEDFVVIKDERDLEIEALTNPIELCIDPHRYDALIDCDYFEFPDNVWSDQLTAPIKGAGPIVMKDRVFLWEHDRNGQRMAGMVYA
ncbi:MAG: hypothetical protein JRC86_04740 [Deltaproteobacteria bacterium]|nr:hypothetical protein [Deltaproteobacteria bacterium]